MSRRLVAIVLALLPAPLAAAAPVRATTSVAVKGHVVVKMETVNIGVTVRNGGRDKVTATAERCAADGVRLEVTGDKVEVDLDEFTRCGGPLTLDVPPGTDLEIQSVDGGVRAAGSFGAVLLASINGAVRADGANRVGIETVSGPIEVHKATDVTVETISGSVVVETSGSAPRLVVETATGGLDWTGACGKECRVELQTLAGRFRLSLDERSDLELRFQSKSGNLEDRLGLAITKRVKNVFGGILIKARYRGGAGTVEVDSFSGSVELRKR